MFKFLFRGGTQPPAETAGEPASKEVSPAPLTEADHARTGATGSEQDESRDAVIARLKAAEHVAIKNDDAVSLGNILTEADALGLEPFEFTRYHIQTHLTLLDFKERWTRDVSGMLEGRPVYVTFDTVRHKRRGEYGHLHVLDDTLVYIGEVRIEIPWSKVVHVHVGSDDDGDTVAIQERGRRTVTKFWFDEWAEALILHYVIGEFRHRERNA
jgi:hypothetical protein